MNQEAKKLSYFNTIFKSLQSMENAYRELEEFDVEYDFSEYFNLNLQLSQELEETIDPKKLTEDKLKKYKKINEGIYARLNYDSPRLYSIGVNIKDFFYSAYEAAEQSIEEYLAPYEGKKRPFFACGYSDLSIFIPECTLLGVMLNDGLLTLDNYHYRNGVVKLDTIALTKKYGLTGQEYEIYSDAYQACLKILSENLKLEGRIRADID